jgi:general secretion pathway protein L
MPIATLWQRVLAVYRSWAEEIAALLPERWRHVMRDQRGEVLVDLSQKEIVVSRIVGATSSELARFSADAVAAGSVSQSSLAALMAPGDDPHHAIVRLPSDALLRKSIVLPLAATRNLREIVRYEVERQSPLDPSYVYFDSRVARLDKPANKLEAELRIFKRASVEAAVSLCRSLGFEPIAIEFAPGLAPGERSFALGRSASLYLFWRRWSTSALSVLACVSALAVLSACEIRNDIAADEVHERVASARTRAHTSGEILRRMEVARDRLALLASEKRGAPLVRIVADVTHLLPDGSWLTEFEKTANEIHIRGFSPNASALVEIFEKSPRFRSAHFRAPLVKSESGDLDRFDMAFLLEGRTS